MAASAARARRAIRVTSSTMNIVPLSGHTGACHAREARKSVCSVSQ